VSLLASGGLCIPPVPSVPAAPPEPSAPPLAPKVPPEPSAPPVSFVPPDVVDWHPTRTTSADDRRHKWNARDPIGWFTELDLAETSSWLMVCIGSPNFTYWSRRAYAYLLVPGQRRERGRAPRRSATSRSAYSILGGSRWREVRRLPAHPKFARTRVIEDATAI
jgi:hypothetical protein